MSLEFSRIALLAALIIPATPVRAEERTLDDTIARVMVAESANPDGSYTYQYSVTNLDSERRLVWIDIGWDRPAGNLELVILPVDFLDHEDRPADVLSGTSPKGWSRPSMQTQEETPGYSLRWDAKKPGSGIPPGGTVAGFSVTVRARDRGQLKADWTVGFSVGLPATSRLIQGRPSRRPALPLALDRQRQR